jgi:biopolymer transport protein ExbD
MAFASAAGRQMHDMNVTPLVDVMLVLLIIFMVTVPAVNYAIDMNIAPGPLPTQAPPPPLRLHIGAGDTLTLDGQPMTLEALKLRFAAEAAPGLVGGKLDPMRQPALELAVEPEVEYELVAQVLARAKNAQLVKVGFAN